MMGLAQEMRHRKSEIETRVAEVDNLMIEQDQPPAVDEHVLGTEIAVHERVLTRVRVPDQRVVETRRDSGTWLAA